MRRQVIDENTKFDLKFNNIWAIVITTIMLTLSFGALNTRMSVIEDKLDNLAKQNQIFVDKYNVLENQVIDLSLKVKELETLIKK